MNFPGSRIKQVQLELELEIEEFDIWIISTEKGNIFGGDSKECARDDRAILEVLMGVR